MVQVKAKPYEVAEVVEFERVIFAETLVVVALSEVLVVEVEVRLPLRELVEN
jgi:hypothetical protein